MRGPRKKRRTIHRLVRASALLAVLLVAAVVVIDVHVVESVDGFVCGIQDAPARSVIVVLGASVRRDGSPSPMLADRLGAAARLWLDGKAPRILVSGDRDLAAEYDEIEPMRQTLVELGVDPGAILEDPRGFRTLDSMVRVHEVFGFDDALVVTNEFHVPRAVYIGRHFGLDVVGVAADRGVERPASSRVRNVGREVLARVVAWVDCHVLGTRPRPDPGR